MKWLVVLLIMKNVAYHYLDDLEIQCPISDFLYQEIKNPLNFSKFEPQAKQLVCDIIDIWS